MLKSISFQILTPGSISDIQNADYLAKWTFKGIILILGLQNSDYVTNRTFEITISMWGLQTSDYVANRAFKGIILIWGLQNSNSMSNRTSEIQFQHKTFVCHFQRRNCDEINSFSDSDTRIHFRHPECDFLTKWIFKGIIHMWGLQTPD